MIFPEWFRHEMLDLEWRTEAADDRVAEAIDAAERSNTTTVRIVDSTNKNSEPPLATSSWSKPDVR